MIESSFWDYSHSLVGEELKSLPLPHLVLPKIQDLIKNLSKSLNSDYFELLDGVFVHKSAKVSKNAYVFSPCIIGAETEVRPSAYIRGNAVIGDNCVIGNSCEVKNSIIFDGAQIPHFNYVGDSVVGYKAHLGAGVILSNVKSDKTPVRYSWRGEVIYTNLKKVGSFLADGVEVGCNSVLNPGTVIGKNATIYPLSSVRGEVKPYHVYKNEKNIIEKYEQKSN